MTLLNEAVKSAVSAVLLSLSEIQRINQQEISRFLQVSRQTFLIKPKEILLMSF